MRNARVAKRTCVVSRQERHDMSLWGWKYVTLLFPVDKSQYLALVTQVLKQNDDTGLFYQSQRWRSTFAYTDVQPLQSLAVPEHYDFYVTEITYLPVREDPKASETPN